MQALGAEAQQIKFAELYVALQQGVVDGQENPLVNIHASKLYEVQKHLALTSHKFQMTPFLMSKRSWDRLSEADRKAVQEAAAEATALQRKLSQESDDKLLAELKAKGVQVDNGRQGRVRQGHGAGRRQVAGQPDRPVRQEGRSPQRARPSDSRQPHARPLRGRCAARRAAEENLHDTLVERNALERGHRRRSAASCCG